MSPITRLFNTPDSRLTNVESRIPPPILVPTTSQPTPVPCGATSHKPSPLAISLPSTSSLHTDKFELTSLDPELTTKSKQLHDKKRSTLDYVQHAALQLYQQYHIPWRKYTKHLKKKQKQQKPVKESTELQDWVTDSDTVTHL